MKTKFLLGTTILLGTSLLPLSVISCSNQVTSNEGENKPSIPGEDNPKPTPPTDNEGDNKPSIPGEDNTNPKPPTDNGGENKPSIPGEDNPKPTPPTDNEGQQPSQPTIVYHEIKGYDDIEKFIKEDKQIVSNLISQVDKTFNGSLVSYAWGTAHPKIIFGNMKVKLNKEDGHIYIDVSKIIIDNTNLSYAYNSTTGEQKKASINVISQTLNVDLHFKSKIDFIDSLPSEPQIMYNLVTGYDDIDKFIKNDKDVISNLISQVDQTFSSLVSFTWEVDPKIKYGSYKVNEKNGHIYIDMSGVTFSQLTPATLKYQYIDKQGDQKEKSISVKDKFLNIKFYFKSEKDFIGGIL